MRLMRFAVIAALLYATPASAGPFTIDVLNTRYTTTVQTTARDWSVYPAPPVVTTTIRTTTSDAPLTDTLAVAGAEWARGTAELFEVTARTHAVDPAFVIDGYSTAASEAAVEFAPLSTGVASLLIQGVSGMSSPHFSEGFVSLFDVTANQLLWNYGWSCCAFDGTLPWALHPDEFSPSVTMAVNQAFEAWHVYTLTLYTETNSDKDGQLIDLKVSGLVPVPEPSTLLLMAFATCLIGAGRSRWCYASAGLSPHSHHLNQSSCHRQ